MEKTREEILAEREAKKQAKQNAKKKPDKAVMKPEEISKDVVKPEEIIEAVVKPDGIKSVREVLTTTISVKSTGKLTKNEEIKSIKEVLTKTISVTSTGSKLKDPEPKVTPETAKIPASNEPSAQKSREDVVAEREAKKLAKQNAKKKTIDVETPSDAKKTTSESELTQKLTNLHVGDEKVKKETTKAERRAIQEAQRAAKLKTDAKKSSPPTKVSKTVSPAAKIDTPKLETEKKLVKTSKPLQQEPHRVKLFSHLYQERMIFENSTISPNIHSAVIKLGLQYSNRTVVGCTARCIAFLSAMKEVITAYETPPQKEFSRGLEKQLQECFTFLNKCRPVSVSMTNALKFIKWQLTQLCSEESEADAKVKLSESIDTYIRDQIDKAAQAISITVQEKISNGDVILIYGW